ncbi:MAG: ATPase, T2SS/T4P/T4SS family [Thermoplasmata archaeon]
MSYNKHSIPGKVYESGDIKKANLWQCESCGALNNEDTTVCRSCGTKRVIKIQPKGITITESKPSSPSKPVISSSPQAASPQATKEISSHPKPVIASPSKPKITSSEAEPLIPKGKTIPLSEQDPYLINNYQNMQGTMQYQPPIQSYAPQVPENTYMSSIYSDYNNTMAKLSELLNTISRFDPNTIKKGILKIAKESEMVRPSFSSSWVIMTVPEGAVKIKSYYVEDVEVNIYSSKESIETYYYVSLPEYNMSADQIRLIQLVKQELPHFYPKNVRLESLEETRAYVSKLSERLLFSIAQKNGIKLGDTRDEEIETVKRLSKVIVKYVAGLGVIEVLLRDPIVQDVYIDAPSSQNRVHIKIGSRDPNLHDKCITNIIVGESDAEALLSRFRMISGRPFSEAMPVLETDIEEYDSRITVIGKPLSPDGIAMALRRHSSDPWTLLKFIQLKSITPMAAGLISFLLDGRSTILVAGPRGAGKTSFVGAIMLEFPQNQRILTIEDTLELPVPQMQSLGYKVQSLWVQSSLGGSGQMTANDALVVSLRLGESAIVLGEVRGQEAKTLYEAMRAGTAGSSVLGTIHGNSSKAIFERVVHDIGIPAISFMATDIVIIAGLANPGGTQLQKRRVLEISEVDKEKEPGNFNMIMKYDENSDVIVATDTFLNNSYKIKNIADMWGMTYEEALHNIGARASIRAYMVEYSNNFKRPDLLKANWVVASNNAFWSLLENYNKKSRVVDYTALVEDWKKWFNRSVKYA